MPFAVCHFPFSTSHFCLLRGYCPAFPAKLWFALSRISFHNFHFHLQKCSFFAGFVPGRATQIFGEALGLDPTGD